MQKIPLYDLERVRLAASKGNVTFSRKAQQNFQDMGYELADVHKCLAGLTAADYRGVKTYRDVEFDVYCPRYAVKAGSRDEVYVKLSSNERSTVPQIAVVSFHLST